METTRDTTLTLNGREKSNRVDLGLALLSRRALPGVSYTQDEIAAWAGCRRSTIYFIERNALKKIRKKLQTLIREEKS